ncbi:hypothetical protein T492DRAFT_1018566 [Pavlovales sp. CCMP2436]|nr:hypothetical protein T492DRAFT_1090149 [Pavlovales sp. CCMP2436]KAJ1628366.1 hypothetical protein T492DRAFT_1018566 [Pavlovales sp. CCMP2436]
MALVLMLHMQAFTPSTARIRALARHHGGHPFAAMARNDSAARAANLESHREECSHEERVGKLETSTSLYAVVHTPCALARMLAPPQVNVVVMERAPRDRSAEAERWELGEQRMELTVGVALGDSGVLRDLVQSGLPSLRGEPSETICELVRLFAQLALDLPRAAQPGDLIHLRWQVSRWREGGPRCSRFHEDYVVPAHGERAVGRGHGVAPGTSGQVIRHARSELGCLAEPRLRQRARLRSMGASAPREAGRCAPAQGTEVGPLDARGDPSLSRPRRTRRRRGAAAKRASAHLS